MDIEVNQWKYLIGITFSTGLVALWIYYYGLKGVLASRSTILELTWPLSALFVGYFFLNESLTMTQWAGAVALIVIMIFISRGNAVLVGGEEGR